jgi:hypothetical protein
MAGEREEGLRRVHVRALPLMRVAGDLDGAYRQQVRTTVDFRVGLPDGRVRVALAVFFVPDAYIGHPTPGPCPYRGFVDPGQHGLAVMGRETAGEQGNQLWMVDPVYGSLSAPVPLPGDTFGWLISDEPDCREWYGRLLVNRIGEDEGGPGWAVDGTWVARVTCTDRVGMAAEEWARVANRLYLERVGELARLAFVPPLGPGDV